MASFGLTVIDVKMPDWKTTIIPPDAPIKNAILAIQNSGYQIALVVEDEDRLIGTVTDGDVRRGLLKGFLMSQPAIEIANRKPRTARLDTPAQEILALLNKYVLRQLPLISPENRLAGIAHVDQIKEQATNPKNTVVLMAGGFGKRLRPLTSNTPKPLLSVGDKPLLEAILDSFIHYGFGSYYISVNYLAESIVEHFGDGSRWGIDIEYLREEDPLGTAGALRLLPKHPELPVIVMNGDLITRVNFNELLRYHEETGAAGTMCVREYDMEVPFGVVELEGNRIRGIDEKPVHRFFVNAGIYVISPQAFDLIPEQGKFDMTSLFTAIAEKNWAASAFPVHEYWLDVGRLDDFERARADIRDGHFR